MQNSIIFEGLSSIRGAIDNGKRKITCLYIDKDIIRKKKSTITWLKKISEIQNFNIEYVDKNYISNITKGSTHGGFAASVSERVFDQLNSNTINKKGCYFALDGIEDPFDLGHTIRTLYALGIDGVVINKRDWSYSESIISKSSTGLFDSIKVFQENLIESIQFFRDNDFKIIASNIRDSVSIQDTNLKKPLFVIIGGEKRGIASKILDMTDFSVKIPYASTFKGSLTVDSVSSILAYEIDNKNNVHL